MSVFVIAHQGGWDEFLMFAVPVALGVWVLRSVERKVRRRAEAEEAEREADGSPAADEQNGSPSL